MDIYVFKRPDGSEWADFRLPENAAELRRVHADSVEQMRTVAANETGRIRALAERALSEAQPESAPAALTADRGFLGRMKWLFTGL